MNTTPDLPFLNIHDLFTNERFSVYLDKHSPWTQRITLNVKQISHLSKSVVIVA